MDDDGNGGDGLARQRTCHVVQTVTTHFVVTVYQVSRLPHFYPTCLPSPFSHNKQGPRHLRTTDRHENHAPTTNGDRGQIPIPTYSDERPQRRNPQPPTTTNDTIEDSHPKHGPHHHSINGNECPHRESNECPHHHYHPIHGDERASSRPHQTRTTTTTDEWMMTTPPTVMRGLTLRKPSFLPPFFLSLPSSLPPSSLSFHPPSLPS